MPVFNFPQLEHEPFWRYLSKLNVYRAQLNCTFEKWKICEVIVLGLNAEVIVWAKITLGCIVSLWFYEFLVFFW